MAFRTRRQNRYIKLRGLGFHPYEARPLSKVPFKIAPYMKEMFYDRQKMVKEVNAAMKGASKTAITRELEARVRKFYGDNRWLTAGKRKIYYDPWKMLRDYESRWREKFPGYVSPWEKRWRDWQGFLTKAERTIQAQRRATAG